MNCKPGELAILVRADAAPYLIGRVVSVIEAAPDMPPYGPAWVVRFQSPTLVPRKKTYNSVMDTDADCPDAWLKPVSGIPTHDEQLDEVPA
ncbi:hypothetical protein D3C72_2402610 [compost metagenome]